MVERERDLNMIDTYSFGIVIVTSIMGGVLALCGWALTVGRKL